MGKHAVVYEIAKNMAGSLSFKAQRLHAIQMHAGTFQACKIPDCAGTRAVLARWRDAERYIEDPDFNREFDSTTGGFEPSGV